ncbi:serine/arginine repetitive matrix protein 1-like [Penaeus chinensis]|uniref:serine/arginine repetitive matrix protein 1-like n=1 Tax=Penaeus chinensis TaxID=139456 RepID=UPI001FB66900|nr:serine/arginine repetitive matrix protein 1-like [Penaeus chinensis]
MLGDTATARSEKRRHDDQAENQDASPPKAITTPQRSRGKHPAVEKEMNENANTPRTRNRTPLPEKNDKAQGSGTPTQRSRSPTSQKRSAALANLTPISRNKSKSRLSEEEDTPHLQPTPTLRSRAKALAFEKQEGSASPMPMPRSRSKTPSSTEGELATKSTPNTRRRSRSQTPVSSQKESITTPRRAKSTARDDSKTQSKIPVPSSRSMIVQALENERHAKAKEKSSSKEAEMLEKGLATSCKGSEEGTKLTADSLKMVPKDTSLSTSGSSDETGQGASDLSGSLESSAPEVRKEFQTEMDKVKRRRSTLGRGRKSIQSMGGRRSLCAAVQVLSLHDQIDNIANALPHTTKVSHLIDICVREALRRLEQKLEGDECVSDLRLDLITQSEDIAGQVSYTVAGQPLVAEGPSSFTPTTEDNKENLHKRIVAYKQKTKELEEEYKAWKNLMKQRKQRYQAAEREFREAKSGETKIEEDQIKQMTSIHRNLLASRPNYHNYIQELQTVRERAMLMLQEVNHTAEVVSNFISTSKAEAESCYAAVEELSFGFLKNRPVKNMLKTMIEPSEIAI